MSKNTGERRLLFATENSIEDIQWEEVTPLETVQPQRAVMVMVPYYLEIPVIHSEDTRAEATMCGDGVMGAERVVRVEGAQAAAPIVVREDAPGESVGDYREPTPE